MTTNKYRPFSESFVRYGTPAVSFEALRHLAEKDPTGFMYKAQTLIDDGKLRFEDLPLRALDTLLDGIDVQCTMARPGGGQRAITTGAFPLLTSATMIAKIRNAYESVPTIGDQLVEEETDHRTKISTVASIYGENKDVDGLKPEEAYPEIGASESYATILSRKNGRMLSITQEMIDQNQSSDIVRRLNYLGTFANEEIEDLTIKRVTDYDGSKSSPAEPYAYRPSGSGTNLYENATNTSWEKAGVMAPSGNQVQSNALQDRTDIQNALDLLHTMKTTDGRYLNVDEAALILLIPYELRGNAFSIANSTYVPGVENMKAEFGDQGFMPIKDKILWSSRLSALSAATWYLGDFKKQFIRKWLVQLEYVNLSGVNTEAYMSNRIRIRMRVGWDCEVGATDYTRVVQNLGATTAPGDGG